MCSNVQWDPFYNKDEQKQHWVKDMDIKLCYVINDICYVCTSRLVKPPMKWLRQTENYGMRLYAIIH